MNVPDKKHVDWDKEFLEFVEAHPVPPPAILTDKIKVTVSQDLVPVMWRIFAKLVGLQAACATLTLFFCPQFEIGFAKYDPLANLVHHSDGFGFMFVCGMIFLGGGAMIAPLFFGLSELKALEKTALIYFPMAALFAVLVFYGVGANIHWSLALPWFLGGTISSLIGFELVKYLRFRSLWQKVEIL